MSDDREIVNDGVYGLLKDLLGGTLAVLCLGLVFGIGWGAGQYLAQWLMGGVMSAVLELLSP